MSQAPETAATVPTTDTKSRPGKSKGRPKTGPKPVSPRSLGDGSKSPTERRLIVVKAMRKAGAVSATTSVTAATLVDKTGLTPYDVYCLLYKHYPLQTGGLVKQIQMDGVRGLSYYLTAKGQKTDPE